MKRFSGESATALLSTARVAEALGVSVTTVKRWVDDGVLPAYRTAGGHRKLLLDDVLRAARLGNLPHADLTRLQVLAAPVEDTATLARRFIQAIDIEDLEQIRQLILQAHESGLPIATIGDEILAPSLAHLGRLWEAGRVIIMFEHLVSEACRAALFEIEASIRLTLRPTRPVAVGGAVEHDHSVLPSLLVKLVLIQNGWDAINLGPHTPFSALQTALSAFAPRLVWLSVTHISDLDTFQSEHAAFVAEASARGILTVTGGQALSPLLVPKLSCTMVCRSLTHLAEFAQTLHPATPRPKRGRPANPTS